jgi:ABC-type transport system substrate-binding protein
VAGYVPPETGDLGYNVTRARELLAESTYKSAENLPKLRLYSSGDALGPMMQDVLSKTLEIDLEVHQVEWSDYLDGLDRGEYPMFTLTWIADYPDPAGILDSLFRSDSPGNSFGYRNDDVDAALDTAASEVDVKKRLADYAQIEDRILRDFPAVPLYYSVDYRLVKPYVKGLQVTPMGILSLKDVYIEGR